jgi:Glycosyl transferases group 1
MRILIAAIHYPVSSGRYIARAFKRLGHDVKTVGPSMGNKIWGIEVDERHVWRPNVDVYLYENGVNKGYAIEDVSQVDLIGQAMKTSFDGWEPELVVTADSTYTIWGQFAVPHVVWGVDNHVRDYALGAQFDHYFLAHHDGPTLPVDDSRDAMTWLPCAYDPEYFTPSPIPMAERRYDVALLGVPYPRRQEIVASLMDAGLKVYAGMGPLYEDYAAIYQNARISLCVSAAGDVAQRVFETAAMGCAIVSDNCTDFHRLDFQKWEHYAPFETAEDAVNACKSLLDNPRTLADMAIGAQDWARPQTWDARAQVVLETMAVKA